MGLHYVPVFRTAACAQRIFGSYGDERLKIPTEHKVRLPDERIWRRILILGRELEGDRGRL